MRREGGPSERIQKPYQTVRRHSNTPLPRRHGGGFKIVVDVLPALRGKDPEDVGEKGRNRRNGRSVVQIPFARQSSRSGNIEIMCKAAFRTAPREARRDHESRSRPVGVMLELSWYRFWSFGSSWYPWEHSGSRLRRTLEALPGSCGAIFLEPYFGRGDSGLIGAFSGVTLDRFGLAHLMTILKPLGAILESLCGVLLADPCFWAAAGLLGPSWSCLGPSLGRSWESWGSFLGALPTTPARQSTPVRLTSAANQHVRPPRQTSTADRTSTEDRLSTANTQPVTRKDKVGVPPPRRPNAPPSRPKTARQSDLRPYKERRDKHWRDTPRQHPGRPKMVSIRPYSAPEKANT